jgi:hypothetical protein
MPLLMCRLKSKHSCFRSAPLPPPTFRGLALLLLRACAGLRREPSALSPAPTDALRGGTGRTKTRSPACFEASGVATAVTARGQLQELQRGPVPSRPMSKWVRPRAGLCKLSSASCSRRAVLHELSSRPVLHKLASTAGLPSFPPRAGLHEASSTSWPRRAGLGVLSSTSCLNELSSTSCPRRAVLHELLSTGCLPRAALQELSFTSCPPRAALHSWRPRANLHEFLDELSSTSCPP